MELLTPRLKLREWRLDDFATTQEYAADPETTLHMIWGPSTEDDTRRFLTDVVATQAEQPRTTWELAIDLRETGRHIGAIGLRVSQPRTRTADFGYVLNKRHWGRGYVPEAVHALLTFGFRELGLHRMYATCDVNNKASIRVLEKSGLRREGTARQDDLIRGQWRDSHFYAILAEEWKD